MAKNKKDVSTRTSIDEINDSLTSVEQSVEKNKNLITWVVIGVVVVAAIVLAFIYLYWIPNQNEANEQISKADIELIGNGNDSIALPIYQKVANEYSNAAGNRAALNAAEILYKQGKYQDAINYLEKYSTKESLVGAASQSLMADCYVNLKKYDDAISYFDKAIKVSDNNALYTPVFMMKKATVLNAQKKYNDALAIYEEIQNKYPQFETLYGVSMDKYIARAKAQASVE